MLPAGANFPLPLWNRCSDQATAMTLCYDRAMTKLIDSEFLTRLTGAPRDVTVPWPITSRLWQFGLDIAM